MSVRFRQVFGKNINNIDIFVYSSLPGSFGSGNKSKSMTSMASAVKSPVGGGGSNQGSPMHMGAGMSGGKQPAWSPSHQPNYGIVHFFFFFFR